MSINIEHKDISVGEIHSPFQWEVLNVAELSTIVPEGVNDVRKVAFVVDDGTGNPTAYVLTQFTPAIEWKPLVNVVGGGGSVIWGGIGGTVANQTDLVAYLQANFYTQAQINSFMNGYYTTSEIDVIASGKADLVGGLVPASQLPSYVDDVLEYANLAALPITGEAGKIYITLDTNRQYRWGGSSYIDITGFVDNVNGKTGAVVVTKEDVGLTNVDNTSDANKPISTATQTALDGKISKVTSTDNAIARYDGVTGQLQNSGVTIDDSNNISLPANILLTGTGRRIQGDFSNTTIANRAAFQTSIANAGTTLSVLPNGTGQMAQVNLHSDSSATNGTVLTIVNTGSEVSLRGNAIGTGTYLPLTFQTGGGERMRINTNGNVGIGKTAHTDVTLDVAGQGRFTDSVVDMRVLPLQASSAGILGTMSNHALVLSTNNTERMRIDTSGNVLVTGGGGLGYGAGSGGTVTQSTSKSTAVTLNKPTGTIIMNNVALGAGASVTFILQNTIVDNATTIIANALNNPNYRVEVAYVVMGHVGIRVTNVTGGSLSEALQINFTIIKGSVV